MIAINDGNFISVKRELAHRIQREYWRLEWQRSVNKDPPMSFREEKTKMTARRMIISTVNAKLQHRNMDLPRKACSSRRLSFDLSIEAKVLTIKF